MSRKVFTAGEVLAAADVNSFLMDQTVMSFAGTAARGSAIGTATEGMTTYLEDSDQLEIWNGSAWRSPSGLTLISKQAIGSGVGTITFPNVFSAAYDDYKVIYSGGVASGSGYITVRLGLNGTPATSSNYSMALVAVNYTTSAVVGVGATDTSFAYAGRFNTLFNDLSMEIRSPFLAIRTRVSCSYSLDTVQGASAWGLHGLANSYNDLIVTGGSFTGGTISVYGYRKE
jgi:hypothetical protein